MSEKDKDKNFLPTKAVRHWAKKYAVNKQYQRRTDGRLVKIESKPLSEETHYHHTDLTQAASLSGFRGIVSEPVSRSHSLDSLQDSRTERKYSVGSIRLGRESVSSGSEDSHSAELTKKSKASVTKDIMGDVEEALKRLAVSVEKDNSKLLPPLPYFNGKCEKPSSASSQTPWIIYNCEEFLSVIEDAVNNDKWTEVGKLKTLQDRLLGPARDFWRVRGAGVNSLETAKAYLLSRFPNTDSYASITNQITEFKRRPGETIGEKATRIQILYGKLEKIAPEVQAAKSKNMLELFFKGLPEVVRDYVDAEQDFNKAVLKSIEYLERHKEFKMRNKDIMLETTFKTEAKVNNVNVAKRSGDNNERGKNKSNMKRENDSKQQSKSQVNHTSLNNINFRGNMRRNFRSRNRFRGNYRGNVRGNFQNNQSYNGTHRGYQGSSGGFRNQGFRRSGRNSYRNNYRGGLNSHNSRGPTCYDCGKFGHTSTTCYARGKGQNRNFRDGYAPKGQNTGNSCWTCGANNHLAKDCTQKNM